MDWLLIALACVWLLPLVVAAGAAIGSRCSGAFRAWLDEILFGEQRPTRTEPSNRS